MTGDAVRLGVVMLCHQALDRAAQAARVWAGGGAALAIHVDARAPEAAAAGMRAALADAPRVAFTPRRACAWGGFALVAATRDAAARLLADHPDLTHVLLVSGSCLPLRPVAELRAHLARHPDTDHIESFAAADAGWTVGGLDIERFTLFHPFDWRRRRAWFDRAVDWQRRLGVRRRLPEGIVPHLGSQWWCLTAPTLRAILDDPDRPALDRWFATTWIPDESYFQTLARRHARRIRCQSPTLARFDATGRPFVLYDDHADMLAASRAFVARKAWPGADGLYARFPRPAPDPAAEPDPAAFLARAEAARARRLTGRPGVLMQSRWPRRDARARRTSAPYAVLHGLADLFPDLPGWLAPRLPGTEVHGALFAPEGAAFARGGPIGPGGLDARPALRDRDPLGWMTALIRHAGGMLVWTASPRDPVAAADAELTSFVADDPNARVVAVTGAWAVPLSRSDLPFDDQRREALRLHRVETRQMAALTSGWARAQVRVMTLAQALADPGAALAAAAGLIAPGVPVAPPWPAMRDVGGLGAWLARMRDAGAPLPLTGPVPATEGPP